ncbi:recombinase family protein [Clostridium tetani]|uniref:DNA integration/recombination protein n=2 Tax=Clostridium tetani TaxID=1513 RepID=Q892F0_CLOTE|nr:DNA integration/recombination protein [Clostridium tetani E88]KGI41032.1 hypothetical protein KY52_00730 [Clostridium tetani]KGI45281.1 hypothetical protein KY55_01170 [Clostridium tetani]KGI45779.1 hypothetical protein KY54_02850 [Clostridium tetani]KHO31209.1 hypothetical protein OR63_10965 [Clostridium tetani]
MEDDFMRAVAYARFSSDNQREESIEAQIMDIKKYALKNNITVLREYVDEAISGRTFERKSFKRMIEDAKKNMFDLILVHKVDRFARNRYDAAIYKSILKKHNIKIKYVMQPIDDSPEGNLMEGILESFAEYYSENLANEVMKGLKINAKKAQFNGGYPPLGYDIAEDKTYIINEREARIVREIFDLYLDGIGYKKIADILNNKGYKNKRGKPFVFNSIPTILKNDKYCGIYTYNKTSRKYKNGRRNLKKYNKDEDIIRVEDGIPKIISKEKFNTAQQEIKKRTKSRGKKIAVREYILSGLIKCECERKMSGYAQKRSKESNRYFYYRCTGCNNSIRAEKIETIATNFIKEQVFRDIDNLIIKIHKYIADQEAESPSELKYLKNELSNSNNQINNIVKMISNGVTSMHLAKKLEELETYIDGIQQRIGEINRMSVIPEDEIKNWLLELKNSFDNGKNIKKIISVFIKNIEITKEDINIDFFVKAPYKGANSLSVAPSAPY